MESGLKERSRQSAVGLVRMASLVHSLPATRLGRKLFRAVTHVEARDAIALTFDDGPDRGQDEFLDVLQEAGVRATFFVVGEQVERNPNKLREIVSCEHEVGVHGYLHRDHLCMSGPEIREDMRRARAVIEEEAECSTRLFRPPYGRFALTTWRESGRQGWERVLWSRDARDWDPGSTARSVVEALGRPQAGEVILLHNSDRYAAPNSWRNTLEALPTFLERLAEQGLRACSVGDLL